MKQRRMSPDPTPPRSGTADAHTIPAHPPEEGECCALLRPPPSSRPTGIQRPPRTSRDMMSRAGRR
jgi:hypothetical protein